MPNGSFLVGRCAACGYAGPARRAAYTAETDGRAHEVLCGASRQAVVLEATAAVEAAGAVPSGVPAEATARR